MENYRKDKYGYKYPLNTKKYKSIVGKDNPYSIENIQLYIQLHGSNTVVLSKNWVDSHTKLKLKCGICGKTYEARWYHIYKNHKFQCNKCGYNKPTNKWSKNNVQKLCLKHGYSLLMDTFISAKHFDMIDKLGYKYSDCSIYTLNKRTNKYHRFHYNNLYQIENMKLYLELQHLPISFVNEHQKNIHSDEPISMKCSQCGKPYDVHWRDIISQQHYPTIKCKKCSHKQSNLEMIVEQYLNYKDIKYEYQKRFSWCRNERLLPFDFFLTDYNTVIEVNGQQHYYDNSHWEGLEWQQHRDIFKKQCCKKHQVNYIEIPFWYIISSSCNRYKQIIDNIVD